MGVTLNGAAPESIFTGAIVGGKNAIINGGFDIWQRGTSVALAASTSTTYTADRWCTTTGANEATTVSRQATGDTTNLPNIQYGLRYQRNSGQTGTTAYTLISALETINSIPYVGKTVTLSFYARAGANFSATSNLLGATVISSTGTDQNPFSAWVGLATPVSGSATLTTTWQRFSYTGTIASTATQLAVEFQYTPTGTAGANDYLDITGVQLELGSTASTFSRAGGSIGGELALCQKYYWRHTGVSTFTSFAFGAANTTTVAQCGIKLPVTMRAVPSSLDQQTAANYRLSDNVTGTAISTSLVIDGVSTTDLVTIDATVASGLTAFRPYWLQSNNVANNYLGFSAEL